jgi:hypothetical protein
MTKEEEERHPEAIFMVDRLRGALMKLNPQEKLLFSTRLRGGPLEDMLVTEEGVEVKEGAVITSAIVKNDDTPVAMVASSNLTRTEASNGKQRRVEKQKQFWKGRNHKDTSKSEGDSSNQNSK